MFQLKFSLKFYIGIMFIVISLVVGNLSKILFFLYFNDVSLRLVWAIIYLVSWPMLFWGAWWAGSETYGTIKKYFTYRYYKDHFREGTQKVYHHTQEFKEKVKRKIKHPRKMLLQGEDLNNKQELVPDPPEVEI